MQIKPNLHLTYCTNIHAGETWAEAFAGLQTYLPEIKRRVSPNQAFGVGLRLSNQAAQDLLTNDEFELNKFHNWLINNDLYVFTLNGFPYGGFHHQKVKDAVHTPGWTTDERRIYTQNLFKILTKLLPEGMDGGISTSPLSYKPWLKNDGQIIENTFVKSTENILKIINQLIDIQVNTGKILHLDIEPEPDGLLENSEEFLAYFKNYLLPLGIQFLEKTKNFSPQEAEKAIKNHLRLCYDVCHFAIEYESHAEALTKFAAEGIQIGKFQISSALSANLKKTNKSLIFKQLEEFNESTYLHQVIAKTADNQLVQFDDLPLALVEKENPDFEEWRIHFHVPLFIENYGHLQSTQKDVIEILNLSKSSNYTNHLEIETYTWEVLPKDLQMDLSSSIERELKWVLERLL